MTVIQNHGYRLNQNRPCPSSRSSSNFIKRWWRCLFFSFFQFSSLQISPAVGFNWLPVAAYYLHFNLRSLGNYGTRLVKQNDYSFLYLCPLLFLFFDEMLETWKPLGVFPKTQTSNLIFGPNHLVILMWPSTRDLKLLPFGFKAHRSQLLAISNRTATRVWIGTQAMAGVKPQLARVQGGDEQPLRRVQNGHEQPNRAGAASGSS